MDDAIWREALRLLTTPSLLISLADQRVEYLAGVLPVEQDALTQAETAVRRTQAALSAASARCISMQLDEATTEATISELRAQHRAAVEHRRMIAQLQADTGLAKQRAADAQELAALAKQRLADADRDLQASVFRLLDIRVCVVDAAPLRLDMVGSIAHELLLDDFRGVVAPNKLTTGAA